MLSSQPINGETSILSLESIPHDLSHKKNERQYRPKSEKFFAEHGVPNIVQCDQGTEFKEKVDRLLQRRGISVIRSRTYHPQSQGKCEKSHREVHNKIHFKMRQQEGFNWARNLFQIQEAINRVPKEVLGNRSPAEVYTNRGNVSLCQEVREASQRSSQRTTKSISRKI